MLEEIFRFTKNKKNIVIYKYNESNSIFFDEWNIKNTNNIARVFINHYTFDGEFLRKVTDGNQDILIREEISINGETLLIEAYINDLLLETENNRSKYVCELMAKKALNLSACC